MKPGKYKVGKEMIGLLNEGDIIDCVIIATDEDSGVSLAYFPKANNYESNSVSFVIEKKNFYVRHGKEEAYVNTSKDLAELFVTPAAKEAVVLVRNAANEKNWNRRIGKNSSWMGKRDLVWWAEEIVERLNKKV